MHGLYETAGDRQAEAGAGDVADVAGAVEGSKQVVNLVRWNTNTLVRHLKYGLRTLDEHLQTHGTAVG